MSRIVLVLGILLIVVGGIGLILGMVGAPFLIASTAAQLSEPTAADLCKPGEQLVTEQGGESYSYSTGYSHNQYYYCVNDAGTRRDVTLEAAKRFVGGFLPSLGTLVIPIISGGLCTVGFFLPLLGFIFSRRRRLQTATSQYVFAGANPSTAYPLSSATPWSQSPPASSSLSASLTDLLRQLEDARKSGLISEDEYNRMRQEILNSMQ